MKNWRWFTQSAVLPLQALYAGYACLTNECDLRTKDFHLLERLEATRIITRDNEDETVRVWHPLQLEAIRDGFDYSARYAWMQKSLNKLRELAFPSDASFATKTGRVKSLSQFCVDLLKARNRARAIADILQEALGIYRRLAAENPNAYLPYVALTANNLGLLLADLGERLEARALFEEALEIYRGLAAENPNAYLPNVALTANNLGTLLADLGERLEARALFEEALEIRRRLAAENPKAYRPDLAPMVFNFAIFYLDQKDYISAAPFTAEILSLLALLVPTAPSIFGPRLQMSLQYARKLYQADEFRSERDSWLQDLKSTLAEKVGPEEADRITNSITMTDEEFERL